MKKIKIACIGKWQAHAVDFARKINTYPDSFLYAVWDNDPSVAQLWAKDMNCKYYVSYDELLSDPEIDGVIITSPTVHHAQQIKKAILSGKHVFVEKPAFAQNEEGYEIQELLKRHPVKFMVSEPMVTPLLIQAKILIDKGVIGQVVMARVRSAHAEAITGGQPQGVFITEEAGGGAMFDMGCHSCHMLEYLFGKPQKAHASFSQISEKAKKHNVDDNTLCVYEYDNGIIATAETGWVTQWYQNGFMIFGTRGCIVAQDTLFYYHMDDGDWISIRQEELPDARTYPMQYWVESIINNTEVERENAQEATMLTEMITAAYRSKGREVEV